MTLNHCSRITNLAMLLLACLLSPVVNAEQKKPDESGVDCSTVGVDYLDNAQLTRAEKLALMEKALSESLSKFELCTINQAAENAANNANAGGGAGADGGSEGNNGGGSGVASDALQGTEPDTMNPTTGSASAESLPEDGSASTRPSGQAAAPNGTTPKDIPSAANDDAIAAQIRVAAENETDPEIREKLWDEYRKYKGM